MTSLDRTQLQRRLSAVRGTQDTAAEMYLTLDGPAKEACLTEYLRLVREAIELERQLLAA